MKKGITGKLTSMICVVMLLFSTCFGGAANAADILFDLNSMGITSDFNLADRMDSYVTRGEFAQIVVNMMAQREVAETLKSEVIFSDAAVNDYNGAINLLYKQGYVSGVGNGLYEPDRNTRYAEACKILISVLGYAPTVASGSDLSAYVYSAGAIGITKGISASGEYLTVREMLAMIDNALDIDKMVPKYYNDNIAPSYEIDEGNTFRSGIYTATPSGLVKLRGIVTADVTTYLYNQRNAMKDSQIEVDGMLFNYSGTAPTGLVGMEVEMYATTLDDGSYDKITSITTTKNNNVTTISGEDINKFTTSQITYDVNESGKNAQKVQLGSVTKYIYNNNIDKTFNPKGLTFDSSMVVRAVDNNNDDIAEVVFVFVYEDRIAQSVNAERSVVTLKSALNGAVNLDLDTERTNKHVEYFDAKGNKTDFSTIEAEDILSFAVSKDGYSVRVVISKNRLSGLVEAKDGEYITIDGIEYKCLKDSSSVRTGVNLEVWVNYRGEIVDFKEKTYYEEGGANFAYIYTCGKSGGTLGSSQIKLLIPNSLSSETTEVLDTETGEITRTGKLAASNADTLVYYLAKKVRVNGVSCSGSDISTLNLINHKAVRYTLDSENKVDSIEFLDSLKQYDKDNITGEYVLNPDGSYRIKSETVSKKLTYNSSEKVFAKANCAPFGIDDYSVAVCVPTANNVVAVVDDDALLNFKFTLEDKYSAVVSAYETDDETHVAKFVVFEFSSSSMNIGNMPDPLGNKKRVGVVKAAGNSIDEDGDEVMSFTMLTIGTGSSVSEQTFPVSAFIGNTASFAAIGKGDLVIYSLDDFNRINNIKIVKDFSGISSDVTFAPGTDYETYCYNVMDIDFDEIDNDNARWVDVLKIHSLSNPTVMVNTFKLPHLSSIAPIVFIVDAKGNAEVGTTKDICYGDRVCVYNPQSFGNVAAVVIYR